MHASSRLKARSATSCGMTGDAAGRSTESGEGRTHELVKSNPAECCASDPSFRCVLQYSWLTNVFLHRIDLGTFPMQIAGFKIYQTADDEVILEAAIQWGSNANVKASARVTLGGYTIELPLEVFNLMVSLILPKPSPPPPPPSLLLPHTQFLPLGLWFPWSV